MNPPNIETATAQEVFDFVVGNLLKQNCKSQMPLGSCAYRGKQNTKCAAGWLIPDEKYSKEYEGNSWISLVESGLFPPNHRELISDLQWVHDSLDPEEWVRNFRAVGAKHNLKWNH